MEPILECNRLTKSYGALPALNNITFTLPRGKIVGLLGPNGSGKTTLLKLAAGLLTPTAGELKINGMSPCNKTKAVVSYLPERPYFNEWMRVSDQLDFFRTFYNDFDEKRAYEMLERLQIDPHSKLKTLSKGTKEKVQLVLVMSRRAQLYLLDEPIGGVDPAARDFIMQTIIQNYDNEATILISTHLIADVEKVLDEFLFISYGQVFMQGTVESVREQRNMSIDEMFREVFKC